MDEANRPTAMVGPPVGLPAIKIILAPIVVADNPLSTPLTPPMAAPAFLAVACCATADDPQLGHSIIVSDLQIIIGVKDFVFAQVLCVVKIVSN
ncbi:hypothetical protein [Pseudomonas proteolytica]|uniref:hypothetical protein n=1 Tax=Pseudomonas proteolytica TaxID=219574 RepID=UPI0030DC9D3E